MLVEGKEKLDVCISTCSFTKWNGLEQYLIISTFNRQISYWDWIQTALHVIQEASVDSSSPADSPGC